MKLSLRKAGGTSAVLVVLAAFTAGARMAAAGVVVEQQVTRESEAVQEQTVMVQGKKEKWINGPLVVVSDLDSDVMTVSNSAAKVFVQRPLFLNSLLARQPSRNSVRQPSRRSARERTERLDPEQHMSLLLLAKLNKTGNHHKAAGYGCDEYAGVAHLPEGDFSLTACFSTSAPGAAEFGGFMRTLMAKAKPEVAGEKRLPPGIPLSLVSTLKRRPFSLPSWMSSEQVARAKQILDKPIITRTVVTKLTIRDLPASTFEPPTSYSRIGMPFPRPAATPRAPAAGAPSLPKPAPGAESKPNKQPN